jgi:hypothetical protein
VTIYPRMRAGIGAVDPRRPTHVLAVAVAMLSLVSVAVAGIGLSLAVFTAQVEDPAIFGSRTLFPGERVTPAFVVGDASSGSEVDRSSPYAVAGDGLTTTTSAWSTSFAVNRYLEFDLNHSLAPGVAVSVATFDLAVASSGAGQACFYFEVRRISTGAVLGTHGSSGSPVGCVTGTTLTAFSTSLGSAGSTSIANDLRLRVFGRESGAASMVVDRATVSGTTAHQSYTLYPVMFRDAADTTVDVVPWGLHVP